MRYEITTLNFSSGKKHIESIAFWLYRWSLWLGLCVFPRPQYSARPKRFRSRGPSENVSRPYPSNTSPKWIDREGLWRRRAGTSQVRTLRVELLYCVCLFNTVRLSSFIVEWSPDRVVFCKFCQVYLYNLSGVVAPASRQWLSAILFPSRGFHRISLISVHPQLKIELHDKTICLKYSQSSFWSKPLYF